MYIHKVSPKQKVNAPQGVFEVTITPCDLKSSPRIYDGTLARFVHCDPTFAGGDKCITKDPNYFKTALMADYVKPIGANSTPRWEERATKSFYSECVSYPVYKEDTETGCRLRLNATSENSRKIGVMYASKNHCDLMYPDWTSEQIRAVFTQELKMEEDFVNHHIHEVSIKNMATQEVTTLDTYVTGDPTQSGYALASVNSLFDYYLTNEAEKQAAKLIEDSKASAQYSFNF